MKTTTETTVENNTTDTTPAVETKTGAPLWIIVLVAALTGAFALVSGLELLNRIDTGLLGYRAVFGTESYQAEVAAVKDSAALMALLAIGAIAAAGLVARLSTPKLLLTAALVGLVVFGATAAEAAEPKPTTVKGCVIDATVKSIGYAGLYGAGVMLVGSGVGVALAPVGAFTLATGSAYVAANTFTGGMLGIGSGAVTHIVLDNEFDGEALRPACIAKAAKQAALGTLGRLLD